jgi:hypothetical protein
MQKRTLSEKEVEQTYERATVYIAEIVAVYNKQLKAIERSAENDVIECAAILHSIVAVTLSIFSSMADGERGSLAELLTAHIEALDSVLDSLNQETGPDYTAVTSEEEFIKSLNKELPESGTSEVIDLASTETKAEWLARQKSNAHDVTCSSEG